jgi:hypothetical protein
MKHHRALFAALVLLACNQDTKRIATGTAASRASQSVAVADSNARIDTTETASSSQSEWHRTFEKAVDGKYVLIFSRDKDSVSHLVALRIQMAERENRQSLVDITTLAESDVGHEILRGDSTFFVIGRTGDYRPGLSSKLFLDPGTKALLKKVDFSPDAGLDSIPDAEAAVALGVPQAFVKALKETDSSPQPGEPQKAHLPAALREHPMPKSTYKEFARARPDLTAASGWDEESVSMSEIAGPFQIVGDRIWFGKIFYEGEGTAGVGGVGYFDTSQSTYTFLNVPEVMKWSASAILVEDQTLWIGLVGRGEGAGAGGGLVRHDLKTGATQRYPVEGVILRIKRLDYRLYLSTTNGVSVLEKDRLAVRYVVEPNIDGKLGLVRASTPAK